MGMTEPRLTTQTIKVLGILISRHQIQISGADIARSTGLASGTLYPILLRLEQAKWVKSEWEKGDPHKLGRPRRRIYSVTALGAKSGRSAFKDMALAIGRYAWASS